MLQKSLLISIIAALLTITLLKSAFADDDADIKLFIDNTANKVLQVLQSNVNGANKQAKLTNIFYDVVDINWMAQYALGKNWQNLNDSNRDLYLQAYKSYLSSSYVNKFTEYNGQEYKITTIKQLQNNNFIVSTKIFLPNDTQKTIDVSYRLKKYLESSANDSQYKITDIIGEGVSLLTTQRSDFSDVVAKRGLDGLITVLSERKNS